jgi:hypothetical protein
VPPISDEQSWRPAVSPLPPPLECRPLTGSTRGRSYVNRRMRLRRFDLDHRSSNRRPSFNEPYGPVDRPCGLGSYNCRPGSRFFFRKIIQIIQKIVDAQQFCKNTPKLFQNYILVPVILHLGPCLTFYNYN